MNPRGKAGKARGRRISAARVERWFPGRGSAFIAPPARVSVSVRKNRARREMLSTVISTEPAAVFARARVPRVRVFPVRKSSNEDDAVSARRESRSLPIERQPMTQQSVTADRKPGETP